MKINILKPEISESLWIEALIDVIDKEDIDIILPGLDFEIPIFAKNKSFIKNLLIQIISYNSK